MNPPQIPNVDPKNPSSLPQGFPFTAVATAPKETSDELTPQSGGTFANLLSALGVSGPTPEEQAFLETLGKDTEEAMKQTEQTEVASVEKTAVVNSEFSYNIADAGKVPATTVASPEYNIEDYIPEQMKKKPVTEDKKNSWVSFDTPPAVFKQETENAPAVKIPDNIEALVFSEDLKKAVAYNFCRKSPNLLVNYPLNSVSAVQLKLVTEKEREVLNAKLQQIEIEGDRRRFRTTVDGYDEAGKPFSRSDDSEEVVNVDRNRKIRYLEILGHIASINGEPLPSDIYQKDEALREYSEEFLNLIYVKAIVPLKKLIKVVSDNFKDF